LLIEEKASHLISNFAINLENRFAPRLKISLAQGISLTHGIEGVDNDGDDQVSQGQIQNEHVSASAKTLPRQLQQTVN
jgi:hypothetical protein